jgi:hypothetical protein
VAEWIAAHLAALALALAALALALAAVWLLLIGSADKADPEDESGFAPRDEIWGNTDLIFGAQPTTASTKVQDPGFISLWNGRIAAWLKYFALTNAQQSRFYIVLDL